MMTSTPTLAPSLCFTSPPPVLASTSNGCDEDENAMASAISSSMPNENALRLVKRPLSTTNTSDSCKKRRKQSTPIRISTTEESNNEGKLDLSFPSPVSPIQFDEQLKPDEPLLSYVKIEKQQLENIQNELPLTQPDFPVNLSGNSLPLWMSEGKSEDWLGAASLHSITRQNSMYLSDATSQSKILNQPPMRIFNPEAYCELCNKEFCNKYFLKTHKANKHRIYIDPPVSAPEAIGMPVNVPNFALALKKPENCSSPIVVCSDKPTGAVNFLNECSVKPPDKLNESEDDKQEQNKENVVTPPELIKEETPDDNEDIPPTPTQLVDYSLNLRRLGVMNPEAFCEICCKEYCNKYFLRTHKMKRHGILITDDNSKDQKLESSLYQTQTSPLNLIMGEQNTNSSSSFGDKKSTNDFECELCGMRFQTSYMAQLHSAQCSRNKEEDKTEEITNNNNKNLAPDTISEDLQKLQTMILQLNDLDVSRVSATCNLCSKEFENRYFLHVHMMTDHGIVMDDHLEPEKPATSEQSCKICGRDGFNAETLRLHASECQLPTEIKEDERPVVGQIPLERRVSVSNTPTSSYCEICNKELCNKYFMKTHMQRMHGIEIENGAQIGGVICNICNKELCSKYFLRVHKHNTHGIVDDGSSSGNNSITNLTPNIRTEQELPQPEFTTSPLDPSLKPDLSDLSNRYFTYFTEVCPICSRRFRSTKWLKTHLIGEHGKPGVDKWNELEQQLQKSVTPQPLPKKQPSPTIRIPNGNQNGNNTGVQNVLSNLFGSDDVKQYHCSFCSFSTPVLAFLFVHEKSHVTGLVHDKLVRSEPDSYQCTVCNQSFRQPDQLHCHIMQQHPFLSIGTLPEDKSDVTTMLKDVSTQRSLPATYALPQRQITNYMMQAFLMDEPNDEQSHNNNTDHRKFAPSIVFLPVLERQTSPLTVSFTLTPA